MLGMGGGGVRFSGSAAPWTLGATRSVNLHVILFTHPRNYAEMQTEFSQTSV